MVGMFMTIQNLKRKIIDVAFELFMQQSYANTSINQITKAVGASKGAIFHYFESKYALAKEAFMIKTHEIWNDYFKVIEPITDSKMRVTKLIDAMVDYSLGNPKLMSVFSELFHIALTDKSDQSDWIKYFEDFLLSIEKEFESNKIPNPNLKALLLVTSLDAIGMMSTIIDSLKHSTMKNQLKKELYTLYFGNYVDK